MSKEQVKEFWEWCGWKYYYSEYFSHGYSYEKLVTKGWQYKTRELLHDNLPSIDLNNLFEYAVPKLDKVRLSGTPGYPFHVEVCKGNYLASKSWSPDIVDKDPALALFWAIQEVINE